MFTSSRIFSADVSRPIRSFTRSEIGSDLLQKGKPLASPTQANAGREYEGEGEEEMTRKGRRKKAKEVGFVIIGTREEEEEEKRKSA